MKVLIGTVIRFSIVAVIFLSATKHVSAFAVELQYEPTIEKVDGRIRSQTFPGRPNYESIKKGDEAETYWIIDLDRPISLMAAKDDKDGLYPIEKNVRSLQLVFSEMEYPKKGKIHFGNKYRVTGTMYHAFSGHHHTNVLFKPTRIDPLK